MGLALLKNSVSQSDVEVAWETFRCLTLAEVNDPRLLEDAAHQLAVMRARATYQRLYEDWSRS